MPRRPHPDAFLPPAIGRTAVAAAVAGFLLSLAAVFAVAPAAPLATALPIAFVAALWTLPLINALARGEAWALILLLAVVLFLTVGNFRSRAWTDKSLDWQVLLKGMAWLGAGVLGAFHLSRTLPLLRAKQVSFAGLFVAMLAVSVLWSPVPGYSLLSAGAFVCMFLFALTLAHHLDEKQIQLAVVLGLGAIVVASLLAAPFTNSLAGFSPGSTGVAEDRLAGLTEHPIGLAEVASLLILACGALIPKLRRHRWMLAALILAALAALVLTRSRMPPLAMAAALVVVAVYARGAMAALLPFTLLVGTGLALVVVSFGLDALVPNEVLKLVSRSGSVQEVTTLSGRLRVWDVVLYQIGAAPWFGHGHAAGQEVLFSRFEQWSLVHAHNLFLQSLLYVGIVGTLPLIAALGAQVIGFLRRPLPFRDAIVLYTLFIGITETSLLSNLPGAHTLLWMVALAMGAGPSGGSSRGGR